MNVSLWFLPSKMYKNRKIDLAITLLAPYPANSEAYLHKLNIGPSRMGLHVLILRKNSGSSLRAMKLRCTEKLFNSINTE